MDDIKHQIAFAIGLIAVYIFFPCFIIAEINSFTSQTSLLKNDRIQSYSEFNGAVSSIFHNPAGTLSAKRPQVTLHTYNYLFDYRHISIGYIYPNPLFTLGLGYSTIYSSNISQTEKSGTTRPSTLSYMQDRYQNFYFSIGKTLLQNISVGANLQYLHNHLCTDTAKAFSADIGACYSFLPEWQLGIHIQNALNTALVWDRSKEKEPLSRSLVVDLLWVTDYWQVLFSHDRTHFQLSSGFSPHSNINIYNALVYSHSGHLDRVSYSVNLLLDTFVLHYTYMPFYLESLQFEQNTVGITWYLNSEPENVEDF